MTTVLTESQISLSRCEKDFAAFGRVNAKNYQRTCDVNAQIEQCEKEHKIGEDKQKFTVFTLNGCVLEVKEGWV